MYSTVPHIDLPWAGPALPPPPPAEQVQSTNIYCLTTQALQCTRVPQWAVTLLYNAPHCLIKDSNLSVQCTTVHHLRGSELAVERTTIPDYEMQCPHSNHR
jgi:hypothetical protein